MTIDESRKLEPGDRILCIKDVPLREGGEPTHLTSGKTYTFASKESGDTVRISDCDRGTNCGRCLFDGWNVERFMVHNFTEKEIESAAKFDAEALTRDVFGLNFKVTNVES
jgi:hypothetical protein